MWCIMYMCAFLDFSMNINITNLHEKEKNIFYTIDVYSIHRSWFLNKAKFSSIGGDDTITHCQTQQRRPSSDTRV
jgi:hypothetical protein